MKKKHFESLKLLLTFSTKAIRSRLLSLQMTAAWIEFSIIDPEGSLGAPTFDDQRSNRSPVIRRSGKRPMTTKSNFFK